MTYRAGIGAQVAALLGVEPGPPRIICDGCGAVRLLTDRNGFGPPSWFLDRKAPPGWQQSGEGTEQKHMCKACKVKR